MQKSNKKIQWMKNFEADLVRVRPDLKGRIDWETAVYLYQQGTPYVEAVERMKKTSQPISRKF